MSSVSDPRKVGGRPRIGGRVTTSLGTELLRIIDDLARENGDTRAETIRYLLWLGRGQA